jgi:hypothetical protein
MTVLEILNKFRKQIHGMEGFLGHSQDQPPLEVSVCEHALAFVDVLPETELLKTVGVFPTGRQSIQFERDDASNLYWEVEVYADRVVCYGDIMTHNPEGVEMEMSAAAKWFLG